MSDIVERLRGIYRIPITDGLGPAGGDEPNNQTEFVRSFPVPSINIEAAAEIERLRRERDEADRSADQWVERWFRSVGATVRAESERDEAREALQALLKLAHGSFEGTSDENDAILDRAIAVAGALKDRTP